ncbi:MAG: hypothetical protein Q9O62_03375 [Ardenticatenia bacterium]|nr:hypothetical protein [Ardenticatenia bacterium]
MESVWAVVLGVSALLLVVSLFGLYQGLRMEATTERIKPLVQYQREGVCFTRWR